MKRKLNIFSKDAQDFLDIIVKGSSGAGFFSKETAPYLIFVSVVYITLFVVVCYGIGENPNSQWATPPKDIPDTRLYYISAIVVFALALMVDMLGWVYTVNPLKKRLYSAIVFTNFIAGITYVFFTFDIGPIWTNFAGRPLRPLLYLEWIATTPTLIFLCSQLSAIPRKWTISVMLTDLFMIITGLLSALASEYHTTLYIIAYLLGVPTIIGLNKFLTSAINSTLIRADKQSLQTLRGITLMVWCVFPIVWQASATNLISPATEALMFAILDVNAKAIYSAVLLGHNFFTVDQIQEFNKLAPKKAGKKDPLDYKEWLDSIENVENLEKNESMKKLLVMAKQEVERTKELQVALLAGVICFCGSIMLAFYTPKAYSSFIEWRRSWE
jgi:bacteriorhodopsin